MNSRRDSSAYLTPGALERAKLAAEPVLAGEPVRVGRARAANRVDRRVVLVAQAGERDARVVADVDRVHADEVLQRLQQVGIDRQRAAVGLGGGQLDERADRVRVPVDFELEARLAVALDQRQRRRRGLQADLQAGGAAQRARVQPGAGHVQQRAGDLLGERQPAAVAALLGHRGERLRQLARDPLEHEPAPAAPARGRDATDPALDGAGEPLLDLGRDLELGEALDHALHVGGGGVRARRRPLLRLPVEAPAGNPAHGVHDVGPVREREHHGLVAVRVATEVDVGDRLDCAHPPTVARALDTVSRRRPIPRSVRALALATGGGLRQLPLAHVSLDRGRSVRAKIVEHVALAGDRPDRQRGVLAAHAVADLGHVGETAASARGRPARRPAATADGAR